MKTEKRALKTTSSNLDSLRLELEQLRSTELLTPKLKSVTIFEAWSREFVKRNAGRLCSGEPAAGPSGYQLVKPPQDILCPA
jgi:hypothetical protein